MNKKCTCGCPTNSGFTNEDWERKELNVNKCPVHKETGSIVVIKLTKKQIKERIKRQERNEEERRLFKERCGGCGGGECYILK